MSRYSLLGSRSRPFSAPGDLGDSGIEPISPALQVESLPSEPPGKALMVKYTGVYKGFLYIKHGSFLKVLLNW